MLFISNGPHPRRHALTGALLAVLIAVGCAPPPPAPAEVRLSVSMPRGGDPGILTDEPIGPPTLIDLDSSFPVRSAQSRSDQVSVRLVQTKVDNPGSRQPLEIIPTPVPKPDVEVIPTPAGVPDAKMAKKIDAEPGQDHPGAIPADAAGPVDYRTWPKPDLALIVTGQQHGYIEPCGCTGLDKQKGGMARRFTFMRQLTDQGWTLLPIDAGNQVRRFGRQSEIKFQRTAEAFKAMDYQAIGFGPDDLRLGVGELVAVAAGETAEDTMYASANVVLLDPTLMPQSKLIRRGGRTVGVTCVLDPDALLAPPSDEILVEPIVESTRKALEAINSSADFRVLMFYGKEDAGKKLAQDVPGFELLVIAGGYGEPTYQPVTLEKSETKMIVTGDKGMYAGIVAVYHDQPMKYARVPLTHEFADAPEMRRLMADYQNQLRDIGLAGLGLRPIPHPSGGKFVGTATCGECHKTAYEIWQGTPHADATKDIVHPGERSDVPRHFDPECLSCHVTGWNAQNYYPYESGYMSLDSDQHLTGNGCENCHGPGAAHSAAERTDSGVDEARRDQLRSAMELSLDKARERCMECHDLDNSPDFHEEGAFDEFWAEIEHYGVD